MTINEFVKNIKELSNEELIEKSYEALNIKTYLPIAEKSKAIKLMIDNIIENKDGYYTYNSITKILGLIVLVIQNYTDLTFEDVNEGYDLLISEHVLDEIVGRIGEDFKEMVELFELRFNDYIREQNSLEAVINRKLEIVTQLFASKLGGIEFTK